MYAEEDLLPLSGLQHFTFCDRRWALVQIEMQWADNQYTVEGELGHERAHSGEIESRPDLLVRRAVPVRSLRLGLSGIADVIEFRRARDGEGGVAITGRRGRWIPHPVEYKRRRSKAGMSPYAVQLCGQAMCLEEMLGVGIGDGSIFDNSAKRRQNVAFMPELRRKVEASARAMHELYREGRTPAPTLKRACPECSLYEHCQPERLSRDTDVRRYMDRVLKQMMEIA